MELGAVGAAVAAVVAGQQPAVPSPATVGLWMVPPNIWPPQPQSSANAEIIRPETATTAIAPLATQALAIQVHEVPHGATEAGATAAHTRASPPLRNANQHRSVPRLAHLPIRPYRRPRHTPTASNP